MESLELRGFCRGAFGSSELSAALFRKPGNAIVHGSALAVAAIVGPRGHLLSESISNATRLKPKVGPGRPVSRDERERRPSGLSVGVETWYPGADCRRRTVAGLVPDALAGQPAADHHDADSTGPASMPSPSTSRYSS